MAPVDDIETYCDNGVWKTRWRNSPKPFAAGGGRERQVSRGATVAQWYGVDHIITDPDGTTAEHNSYRYPGQAAWDTARRPSPVPAGR